MGRCRVTDSALSSPDAVPSASRLGKLLLQGNFPLMNFLFRRMGEGAAMWQNTRPATGVAE